MDDEAEMMDEQYEMDEEEMIDQWNENLFMDADSQDYDEQEQDLDDEGYYGEQYL